MENFFCNVFLVILMLLHKRFNNALYSCHINFKNIEGNFKASGGISVSKCQLILHSLFSSSCFFPPCCSASSSAITIINTLI